MKKTTNHILSIALLVMLTFDCQADDNIFEMSTAVSYTTIHYGTSSNKFYSAENKFKAVQFAQLNWSNLTADMARGQGEYLSAMANLMAVKATQKPAFYKVAKAEFNQLLPGTETTAEQLVDNLKKLHGKLQ